MILGFFSTHDIVTQRAAFGCVAVRGVGFAGGIEKGASGTHGFKIFLRQYFYFCMSLVFAAIVPQDSAAR
jgi:hypothetical protein